jgi:hypothetical protein
MPPKRDAKQTQTMLREDRAPANAEFVVQAA